MPTFLVTSNPGRGKSALAGELVRRGLAAIDPDDDPELAHWEDAAGRPVSGPPRPDRDWLGSHRWVWNRSRLQEILTWGAQPVFVCGIAWNQDEFWDLFDRVFLLLIDERTQEARLAAAGLQFRRLATGEIGIEQADVVRDGFHAVRSLQERRCVRRSS